MKTLQILVLILGLTVFANAQKAILSGTVYDQLGSIIPDAQVVVKNKNGKMFETLTDRDGKYKIDLPYTVYKMPDDFRSLSLARYTIKVSLVGFHITEIEEFIFTKPSVGNMQLDFVLEVGTIGNRVPINKNVKRKK